MRLSTIIKPCNPIFCSLDTSRIEISRLCNDSRKVVEGSLFVAVNGCGRDGRLHITNAVQAGAAAIMYEDIQDNSDISAQINAIPENICRIVVHNSRLAVAMAADVFYQHPSGKLKLVGITGTNGKTSTVTLLYNLFRSLGYECGLLSTIANYVGSKEIETLNTTSDPVTINALLNEMLVAGCEYCFMEVSSIGVDQLKVAGLEFSLGIFSNLTHDHLDYHGTFASYLDCKRRFFDALGKKAIALTNIDDRNGKIMVQNTKAQILTYSCRNMADHCCRIIEQGFEGMLLNIDGTELWTRLIGAHNAYNLLAVYSAALALGAQKEEVLVALSNLKGAKGRLESIVGPRGICVVIDYAHTPDALENVLTTLRGVKSCGELICVFGCGGDRDISKRAEMGAIASRLADRIVLTSDNSRSESTEEIMAQIRVGIDPQALAHTVSISDRREAIRAAIMFAPEGSCILLAGKGHETYQILGSQKTHFDEREIVAEIFDGMS